MKSMSGVISSNTKITPDIVWGNPNFPWKYNILAQNSSFTWVNVLTRAGVDMNKPYDVPPCLWLRILRIKSEGLTPELINKIAEDNYWMSDYEMVIKNTDVPVSRILKEFRSLGRFAWMTSYLLRRKDVTPACVLENIDFPWYWEEVLRYYGKKCPDEIIEHAKSMGIYGLHTKIHDELIGLSPEDFYKNWTPVFISKNRTITWELVQKTIRLPWNWGYLSRNPCITWDVIRDNPGYKWCPESVSMNPSITLDIIVSNPDYPWSWKHVSCNPSITLAAVKENLNLPWHWSELSHNLKLTGFDVYSNLDLPWGFNELCMNQYLRKSSHNI